MGTWSFLVRYEEHTPDADPDPYLGRYVGEIRMFRLTLGTTTVDFPADQAQLVVSDGALGVPNRESILLEASFATSSGVMRVNWSQLNQPPNEPDLRGVEGSLTSDALPAPSMIAKLATSSPFDRFLLLRIDRAGGGQPLLYISSSNVSVLARRAVALACISMVTACGGGSSEVVVASPPPVAPLAIALTRVGPNAI